MRLAQSHSAAIKERSATPCGGRDIVILYSPAAV